jgi:hypothetical protein
MDKEVFLGSCATADDVWFNAMRVLKGTGVKKVFSVDYSDDFFELPVARVHSLRTNNVREGNDRAIMSVYGRYGLFPKLTQWHER